MQEPVHGERVSIFVLQHEGKRHRPVEHRRGEVRLFCRGSHFAAARMAGVQAHEERVRQDFHADTGDVALVAAVEAIGQAQERGELLDPEAFGGRQRGEFLVLEIRRIRDGVRSRRGKRTSRCRATARPLRE